MQCEYVTYAQLPTKFVALLLSLYMSLIDR